MTVEIPVVFPETGSCCRARLVRRHADFAEREVGALVTGSWLTVTEQMPLHYVHRLAQPGATPLVFVFSSFGESAGEPRRLLAMVRARVPPLQVVHAQPCARRP
jgi:hypothetical protein